MLKSMLIAGELRCIALSWNSSWTVQETCPWFPDEGTVNITTRTKVGEKLRDWHTAEGLSKMPIFTFTLWALIRDALDHKRRN